MNRTGIADFPLLRILLGIHLKSRQPSFKEMRDSFVLVAYASLAASRTLLQQLLACLNFTWTELDLEDLFCWYKKVISMNYGSSTSSWKPWRWVSLDLILTMRDIYIDSNLNPLTKFTSSSRSPEFILLWYLFGRESTDSFWIHNDRENILKVFH